MNTLYDILGALPDDDAEDIRIAFRKAVKETHPDINSNDPDSLLRFRQIVRAHAILGDSAQRATYDRLMAFAPRSVHSDRIHNFASGAITVAVISMGLIGAYAFFGPVSKASVKPPQAAEIVAPPPAALAAVAPAKQPDVAEPEQPPDRREGIEVPDEANAPGPAALMADAANVEANTKPVPSPRPPARDAKSYREEGKLAYRDGDLHRALGDFDRAIQLDRHFAEAYVDRGIVLYQMREFRRAFADLAQAKRIAGSNRIKASAPTLRKPAPASGKT